MYVGADSTAMGLACGELRVVEWDTMQQGARRAVVERHARHKLGIRSPLYSQCVYGSIASCVQLLRLLLLLVLPLVFVLARQRSVRG